MAQIFSLEAFDRWAKEHRIKIKGSEMRLEVDWDDVDHYGTAAHLQKAFAILNDHWDDPKYRGLSGKKPRSYDAQNERAQEIMRELVDGQ